MGAGVAAASTALTGANQAVLAGPGTYRGVCVRETAAAPAVLRIYDNATAASGTLLDVVALAANGSASLFYPGGGLRASNGVYVQIVSGTVEGSVRIG